jgi:CelD/BcsL family acetyltransferase involved in cellulose biosynthesis
MPFHDAGDLRNRGGLTPLSIEPVVCDEGLLAVEADWNRLSKTASAPNIFSTFDWFSCWLKGHRQELENSLLQPHVLILRQNGIVSGIAPLLMRRISLAWFTIRKLEFATIHSDYNDLVLGNDSEPEIDAVIEYLAKTDKQWDLADLRDLRGSGEMLVRIERALVRHGLHYRLVPENDGCLYMPIQGPWKEAMKQKHLRFARRVSLRFEELAQEGFRVRFIENPQLEAGLIERLIAVEAQKHVDGKLSIPVIGKYVEVFQTLFNSLGPAGWITVAVVEREDQLVAWRLFYKCGDRLWDYLTAYDHSFSDLSPGVVLICSAIDYGFSRGLHEFDFLRGEETYKLRWTSHLRRNHRLMIWNRRWKSRLCSSAYSRLRT